MKRFLNWNYGFDYFLLVLINVFLISSVVDHFGHSPHIGVLFFTGLIAVLAFLYPFYARILTLMMLSIFVMGLHFYEPFQEIVFGFGHEILIELWEWEGIYDFPGEILTLLMSICYMFAFMLLQLKLIDRGSNNSWMLVFGAGVYLWLWFQYYPNAEEDLLIFLLLAVPTAAIFHLRHRSEVPKIWYKIGVFGLSGLTFLLVSVMPQEIGPVTYEQGHQFVKQNMPFLLELRTRDKDTIVLGESEKVPGEAEGGAGEEVQMSGYQPGGELGGALTQSNAPVFDVQLESGSLPLTLYLRGNVSDYYTGRRWETREAESVDGLEEGFRNVEVYDQDLEISVSYFQSQADIFGLFPTESIEITDDIEYQVDSYGNISVPEEDEFEGNYTMEGKIVEAKDLEEMEPQAELVLEEDERAPFLQMPEDLPQRVEALSDQITEEAESDLEKVELITEYLAQYPYNRETPGLPEGEDFVDHFLFELEEGYCTYYASAMAILLRAQEVPTRYVEGFRVPFYPEEEFLELRAVDEYEAGTMTARQNNAHAWVEVFVQGYGWVVFEPTQPYDIVGGEAATETPEKEDIEEEKAPEEEKTGEAFATGMYNWINWGMIIGLPLLGLFLLGSGIAVKDIKRAKDPGDLYYKVTLIFSIFEHPPKASETPGMVISHMQSKISTCSEALERMKALYYEHRYAGDTVGKRFSAQDKDLALERLPVTMIQLYYVKVGLIAFLAGLLKIFGRLLLDKWDKTKYDSSYLNKS